MMLRHIFDAPLLTAVLLDILLLLNHSFGGGDADLLNLFLSVVKTGDRRV